jgi:hypothetical protein
VIHFDLWGIIRKGGASRGAMERLGAIPMDVERLKKLRAFALANADKLTSMDWWGGCLGGVIGASGEFPGLTTNPRTHAPTLMVGRELREFGFAALRAYFGMPSMTEAVRSEKDNMDEWVERDNKFIRIFLKYDGKFGKEAAEEAARRIDDLIALA